MDRGTFSLECPGCGRDLEVEIGFSGKESISIDGKRISSQRAISLRSGKKEKKPPIVAAELPLEMELPFHRRMRFITVILLLVFVLGILSSFTTLLGSFTIYDLEEKSPNKLVTLSVWVIDADSGRPLEDVNVVLTSGPINHSATSDYQGLAVLENLTAERMELEVSREGYKTVRSSIALRRGSPNVIDIPMERGSSREELPVLVHQFEHGKYSGFITNVAASLMLVSSVMALISAIFVYRKEFFSLVLLGAFISVFSFGFFVGSLLAVLAVVLIILSYEGFTHTHRLIDLLNSLKREDIRSLLKGDERKLPPLPPADRL